MSHKGCERLDMTITILDKAQNRLGELLRESEQFLRVRVTPGGCSGMTFDADIDSERQAGESVVYETEEIRIVTDAMSRSFLDGLVIDYSDDLIKSGFRFSSTNAQSSCGCGASFSVDADQVGAQEK